MAVKDILSHSDKVEKNVKNARKMVFEKYDWNLIAKNMRERVFGSFF